MDQLYKYFRWLSLDIVLGAIFFLAYLGDYYQLSISFNVYFALGTAVWLIYTTDHLIDARSVDTPSNDRHLFHQRYYHRLIFIAGLVMTLALLNMYFLDLAIIRNGALLSAGCILYLMLVYFYKKLWVKELLVALAYACGIFLAPFSLKVSLVFTDVMLVFQLATIALLNLIIFSLYDFARDEKDGFNSLVIRLGIYRCKTLIQIVMWPSLVLSCIFYASSGDVLQLLYLTMTCLLGLVFFLPKYFSVDERFRVVGDGIFYLSLLFLIV